MMPATSEIEKVRFHTLNAKTGNRVVSQYVDAVTGKPVREEDEAQGYARGEKDYDFLEEDELNCVALESTRTIDIQMFVPAESIGWIWYDQRSRSVKVAQDHFIEGKGPHAPDECETSGDREVGKCRQYHGCAEEKHHGREGNVTYTVAFLPRDFVGFNGTAAA